MRVAYQYISLLGLFGCSLLGFGRCHNDNMAVSRRLESTACIQGTCAIGESCVENICINATEINVCGPGPEVESFKDGQVIRLRPTSNTRKDYRNLKWAVETIPSGGVIDLCEGEFLLGTTFGRRRSIIIKKGLTLKGKHVNGEWLTVIKGGGSVRALLPDRRIGPFKVNSREDKNPVIFDSVWLRDWVSEAIVLKGCNGFTFTQSKLSHPLVSGFGFPLGLTNYIHGIFAISRKARGELYLTNSDFDVTRQEGRLPNDAQILSLYGGPPTEFSKIVIERNSIKTQDEAIELLVNDPPQKSTIVIRENTVDVSFDVPGIWPYHYAFFINNNKNVEEILIEENYVRVRNVALKQPCHMGVFGLTGNNFAVQNNTIEVLGTFDGSIFRLGSVGNLILYDFGMSVTNSLFQDNEIIGKYEKPGIDFTGGLRNKSRNNVFRIGASLANGASGYTVSAKRGRFVCDNTFEGDTGKVEGDLQRSC